MIGFELVIIKLNSNVYFFPSWVLLGPRTEAGLISFALRKLKSAAAVG
jgi:hypothetical protein